MPEKQEHDEPSEPGFWDSWPALFLMIAAIVLGRMYILEPFKIPSGSMEPTLIGHEDFGDRILTSKLAYASGLRVAEVMGVSLLFLLGSWLASMYYPRKRSPRRHLRSLAFTLLLVVLVVGGIGFGWARDAVASQPKRFDVVVFEYNTDWNRSIEEKPTQNINYIKRLIGLPGDHLMISGGDLFLKNNDSGKYEMLRKWDPAQGGSPKLQDSLWYPVSKAWSVIHKATPEQLKADPKIAEQLQALAFPWSGAEDEPGVKLHPKWLELDGTAPVQLEYKFQVSNVYLKQGRWPFRHIGCPAAHKTSVEGPDGVKLRDPSSTTEYMSAYVSNTWEGVQCPNCGEVIFPLADKPAGGPALVAGGGGTNFFYGGDYIVGDLRLDVELNVESSGGSVELQVGNTLQSALWKINTAGTAPEASATVSLLRSSSEMTPGKHSFSLAYVDATLIAVVDGHEIARRPIEGIGPISGSAYRQMQSLARIQLSGIKGKVTKLDLYRDLFHTPGLPGRGSASAFSMSQNDPPPSRYYEDGNYAANIPPGKYLMLGDNSPSSSDGRVWGFVPQDRILGRASVVWWPLSRWRMIK